VSTIDPFEATLREHTPLTSIDDPGALVEFLNQRNLQTEMVMDELKRVTKEKDDLAKERSELKAKLDDATSKNDDETAELQKLRDELEAIAAKKNGARQDSRKNGETDESSGEAGGDAFFSYEEEVSREKSDEVEELQAKNESLTEEIKGFQTELQEQRDYINELSTENASMRTDLENTRLNLDAMENKVRIKESNIDGYLKELADARQQLTDAATARDVAKKQEEAVTQTLVQTESQLVTLQERLRESNEDLKKKAADAEENLKKYQEEHAKNLKDGKYAQREEKGLEALRNLVNKLREELKAAEVAKQTAERDLKELQFEVTKLEAEAASSAKTISHLRAVEATTNDFKKRLDEAERDRNIAQKLADSKKGHEARVASLSIELKKAQHDRDAAYAQIIQCANCVGPASKRSQVAETLTEGAVGTSGPSRIGSESTEVDGQATEPGIEAATPGETEPAASGEGKKKNKKKKPKSKKKATPDGAEGSDNRDDQTTLNELLRDTSGAHDKLKHKFGDNPLIPLFGDMFAHLTERNDERAAEHDILVQHHEGKIEELQQKLQDNTYIVQAKEDQIMMLQSQIASAAAPETLAVDQAQIDSLRKDIEGLRAEMSAKDAEISKLQDCLKSQAELEEELESVREDRDNWQEQMIEHGRSATDAKHELKEVKERRDRLQQEFDDLEKESDGLRKQVKEAQSQNATLTARSEALQAEVDELKAKPSTDEDVEGLKKQVSTLEQELAAVNSAKASVEKQLDELQAQHIAAGAASEAKYKTLEEASEELKAKNSELSKDLAAATDLAQQRFKDLKDVRELCSKVQGDLKALQKEAEQLKSAKSDLDKANINLKKLEAREKDLKSEIAEYKSQAAAKDSEITSLKEKAKKSDERSRALEDSFESARKELEKSERTRNEALEARDKVQTSYKKLEDENKKSKTAVDELERSIQKLSNEVDTLKEELQLKTASEESSRTYLESMQNQSREMATRMAEANNRVESLQEEVTNAHRLLNERGHEGEKMRRLLKDVEIRAESRVQEMREKMDLAVEERDRAEEEASTIGRRKAREIEALKAKLRDAESDVARATEARASAERREQTFKDQRAELERRAAKAEEDAEAVRRAMVVLQDSLDDGAVRVRDLERARAELRKQIDERDARLDKLQKSSKAMAEELRAAQQGAGRFRQSPAVGGSIQSSTRSSTDSTQHRARIASPVPRSSTSAAAAATAAEQVPDFVYLRTVLLQFLQQREKTHQIQLVPVLGQLLHFDKAEEERWISVISAK
jgi:chromosome segregation ATPase